jgi:hypothetical protein
METSSNVSVGWKCGFFLAPTSEGVSFVCQILMIVVDGRYIFGMQIQRRNFSYARVVQRIGQDEMARVKRVLKKAHVY